MCLGVHFCFSSGIVTLKVPHMSVFIKWQFHKKCRCLLYRNKRFKMSYYRSFNSRSHICHNMAWNQMNILPVNKSCMHSYSFNNNVVIFLHTSTQPNVIIKLFSNDKSLGKETVHIRSTIGITYFLYSLRFQRGSNGGYSRKTNDI